MEQLITALPYFQLFDVQGKKKVKKVRREENSSELHPKAQTKVCDDSSCTVTDETELHQLLELPQMSAVPLISPPDVSEGDDNPWMLFSVHPS